MTVWEEVLGSQQGCLFSVPYSEVQSHTCQDPTHPHDLNLWRGGQELSVLSAPCCPGLEETPSLHFWILLSRDSLLHRRVKTENPLDVTTAYRWRWAGVPGRDRSPEFTRKEPH